MVWREQGNPRYIILADFTRMWDLTWRVSDCEGLVGDTQLTIEVNLIIIIFQFLVVHPHQICSQFF